MVQGTPQRGRPDRRDQLGNTGGCIPPGHLSNDTTGTEAVRGIGGVAPVMTSSTWISVVAGTQSHMMMTTTWDLWDSIQVWSSTMTACGVLHLYCPPMCYVLCDTRRRQRSMPTWLWWVRRSNWLERRPIWWPPPHGNHMDPRTCSRLWWMAGCQHLPETHLLRTVTTVATPCMRIPADGGLMEVVRTVSQWSNLDHEKRLGLKEPTGISLGDPEDTNQLRKMTPGIFTLIRIGAW